MSFAEVQEFDQRLSDAMDAAGAKGVDASHILYLQCKGDEGLIRWYADRHNAHAEVRELVEAFKGLRRVTNAV